MSHPESRQFDFMSFLSKYGIVFILIGLCIILSIATANFASLRNIVNIIRQVSIIGIISIGVTFCIISGGIDLSSGSVLALVSVVVASMSQVQVNPAQPISILMPLAVALVAGLLIGAVCGLINGFITAYGEIPPFIATLGMMTIARGAAQLYSGGRPVGRLKPSLVSIGSGSFLGHPSPIVI